MIWLLERLALVAATLAALSVQLDKIAAAVEGFR